MTLALIFTNYYDIPVLYNGGNSVRDRIFSDNYENHFEQNRALNDLLVKYDRKKRNKKGRDRQSIKGFLTMSHYVFQNTT